MDIGHLKKRITINIPGSLTPDGIGGFTQAAGMSVEVWASVTQLSEKEKLTYGIEIGIAAYSFLLRYETGKNFSQAESVTFGGETLRVVSVVKDLEDGNYLKILTYGRTD